MLYESWRQKNKFQPCLLASKYRCTVQYININNNKNPNFFNIHLSSKFCKLFIMRQDLTYERWIGVLWYALLQNTDEVWGIVKFRMCEAKCYRESHRVVIIVLYMDTGEIVTNAHYHSHHGIDPLVTPPHVPLSTLLTSPPPPAWCLSRAGSLCLGAPGHSALFEFCWPGCG